MCLLEISKVHDTVDIWEKKNDIIYNSIFHYLHPFPVSPPPHRMCILHILFLSWVHKKTSPCISLFHSEAL